MPRHINLLDPPQKTRSPYASAAQMGIPILVVLLTMGTWTLISRHQLATAKKDVAAIDAEIRPVREQTSQLQAGTGAEQANTELREQITRARTQLEARQRIQSALQRGELGSTQGFSEYLRGLARQTVPGVWLTGMDLNDGGKEFILSGRALKAEGVASLVRLLGAESSFRGRTVGSLQVLPAPAPDDETSAPAAAPVYAFRISSTGPVADAQSDAAADTGGNAATALRNLAENVTR